METNEIKEKKGRKRKHQRLLFIAVVIGLAILIYGVFAVVKAVKIRQAQEEMRQKVLEFTSGQKAGERKVITVNGVKFAFRWCPAGTFMMGPSADEEYPQKEALPQHEVTLTKGFWMMETEVTQKQWKAIMGNNPSYFNSVDILPVDRVSWIDCQDFCAKTGMQLPTEAQWEYACRAGSTTAYFWGNEDDKYIEYRRPKPVAYYAPNKWGLYDMNGNSFEYCQDWYGSYPAGSVTDPVGPSTGSHRIIRGGGWIWNGSRRTCRSASRNYVLPGSRSIQEGFRCVIVP